MAGGVHGRQGCMCVAGVMHGGGHAWQWGHVRQGDVCGGGMCGGRYAWWGARMAGEMATAVGGTQPTRTHSC